MGKFGVAKTRRPIELASGEKLRAWRKERGIPHKQMAAALNVSPATVFRYETGYPPPIDIANRIVELTRGELRYRDLYWNFHPEYA